MLTTDESRSDSPFTPNSVGMTTMGNKPTESKLTPSEPLGFAVGVAVSGLLMVFVAVAVIVIALLVVKKCQAHKLLEGN